jgi:hypothetical protein
MTMTKEQQQVFEQAVSKGIVGSSKEAYELGAADLRSRLQQLKLDETAAAQAEAEALAKSQPSLF